MIINYELLVVLLTLINLKFYQLIIFKKLIEQLFCKLLDAYKKQCEILVIGLYILVDLIFLNISLYLKIGNASAWKNKVEKKVFI